MMVVRTLTLYVTGEFGDMSDEEVADAIFEMVSPEGEILPMVLGITLPSEEAPEPSCGYCGSEDPGSPEDSCPKCRQEEE